MTRTRQLQWGHGSRGGLGRVKAGDSRQASSKSVQVKKYPSHAADDAQTSKAKGEATAFSVGERAKEGAEAGDYKTMGVSTAGQSGRHGEAASYQVERRRSSSAHGLGRVWPE